MIGCLSFRLLNYDLHIFFPDSDMHVLFSCFYQQERWYTQDLYNAMQNHHSQDKAERNRLVLLIA